MRVCVISFKECWRDPDGRWRSSGGFPGQMRAIRALFDAMTLLVVGVEPRPGGEPLPPDAPVIPLRSPVGRDARRKLSVVAHLPAYLAQMRRAVDGADVVHAPVPGDLALLGLLTGLASGKRVLGRYCGAWHPPPGEATIMNRVTRQVMRHAARSSHVMLATGIGEAPPAPGMRWIHATAITEAEVAGFHPDLDRPARRPLRLAWAGRLSGEKGVAELRAACHLLAADPPPGGMPELVIAGDGPERGPLAADLEPIMPGRVRFLGQLDRQALLGTLAEADLLVLPSRTEAFAKARLDAMLAGTPVLTTPVGGGRELVGPDGCRGWVVPARDAEALADRLRRLASEQLEWPGLRRRCRAFAEPFTLEEWRDRIGELCEAAWGRGLRSGDGAGR